MPGRPSCSSSRGHHCFVHISSPYTKWQFTPLIIIQIGFSMLLYSLTIRAWPGGFLTVTSRLNRESKTNLVWKSLELYLQFTILVPINLKKKFSFNFNIQYMKRRKIILQLWSIYKQMLTPKHRRVIFLKLVEKQLAGSILPPLLEPTSPYCNKHLWQSRIINSINLRKHW